MNNVRCITATPNRSDLVVEQSAMRENIRVIKQREIPVEQKRKLRVAAYCRVSTDKEEQKSSIDIQMRSYREMIAEHPDWELADIYADPGKTGTSVKKRKEFLRMIEDAKAGKIDIILAKSTSRFARNTEDLLKYTRMLRDINVGVVFEKEKIDTRSTTSEMLLTIFAAFSQEESHDISSWAKVGIRNDAARGKTRFHSLYGYTSKGKEKWIIVPEEAKVVQRVFESYVKGKTIREIAAELNAEGIPSKSGIEWNSTSINQILRNEKYIGDYLFQKHYIDNFLTHKLVSNRDAKLPQYYITDDHDALVSREDYKEAQEILFLRDVLKGSNMYPYYGFLVCPDCGTPLVSFVLPMQMTPRCWVCPGSKDGLKRKDRSDCEPFAFYEVLIDEAVRKAISGLKSMDGVDDSELSSIQKTLAENGRIERYYLKTLVEKITFPDYEHLTIHWKNGKKATLTLKITKYWTHPYPKLEKQEDGFVEFGGQQMPVERMDTVRNSMAMRENHIQNLEITMPDAEAPIQIPIVKKVK